MLLLVTFLSTIEGFSYLHEAHFVTTQLDKWYSSFNSRYVFIFLNSFSSCQYFFFFFYFFISHFLAMFFWSREIYMIP